MAKLALGEAVKRAYDVISSLDEAERPRAMQALRALLGETRVDELGKLDSQPPVRGLGGNVTLVKYLKSCDAHKPARRFLATCQWLQDRGAKSLALIDITTAVKDAQLGKFSNPSTFLRKNIQDGFIEGKSNAFFVTEDGRTALGTRDE
ncbi:MAG: hypothetical protein U0573_08950 [Phycisphaerales bacterium]|nr:hypothetical protein [Planctomycetota bacterium]